MGVRFYRFARNNNGLFVSRSTASKCNVKYTSCSASNRFTIRPLTTLPSSAVPGNDTWFLPRLPFRCYSPPCAAKIALTCQGKTSEVEQEDRRSLGIPKCFAHYDVQSALFNVSDAVANQVSLGHRKNTTTGASAASQYQVPCSGAVCGNTCGSAPIFEPPLGSHEELNPKQNLETDEGDGKSNELVLSCPHFRNEIGGEGERKISLSRANSANCSGGESCSFESSLSSHCTNAGVSVLEVPRENQLVHREKVKRYIIEHIDLGAYYYHKYFYGKDHQNYFGMDENLGPVAVSVRREKLEEKKEKEGSLYNYRIIFRTSQLTTLRGAILEDAVPSTARHGTARGLPLKEVLEYVVPELNIQCLRLALSSPKVPEQLLKLDEQGGAGGNWATVGRRSRGGRRVRRQREKRKGKGRELADVMERRKVDILCVQETRWKGSKARSIGAGFKLFYYGVDSKRNGVGVVLKEEFVRNVLEVGCELEEKERFWSELDEVMESIPTGDEEVMGKFGVKERNLEGQMVVDFAKRMDMGVVNTYFQKREEHRVTYKSGGRRTQIEKKTKWWKLKKEECSEVIRETGRKVLGVSSGRRKEDKETWWWNEEVQDSIQRKRLAKKKWDMDRTEENRQEYKELQRRVKREVSKAKQKAYEELYTRLDTREGEKDLYRVLTSEESVQRRWKEYFEELMNEENEREKRVEGVWERVVEARLRKYRDGQKELHCVFVDLEKAYDRVPREELWYCMRKSGVAEKYVRVVQDMYERSRTVVRCAVGQTEEFNVEVGLHQGSALSPFLFAIVMDQLSEEVRQESPWTMMFADDIVICSESREQVEENLERWRFALERRGMKVSRSKTEYMCVNEREGSGTVRLQGEEVKKVQEFKYLGSTVQSNGECGKEVKKRVQAGWNGWRKVSGVLCDQKISARIKGKVYRTVVRPAMLYGLETVSLRKRQESELELSFQHKVGVLYCKAGQSTEEEMYNNESAGPTLDEFLDLLGQRVRLKGFNKYKAQLDNKTDSTGTHSLYTTYKDHELMFHVSTLLPYTPNNRQQLLRKRHIGNDIVTIVFQEPGALPFTPKNIRSHFQHVFVIVKVHNPCNENVCYSVAVSRSKDVPLFGPPIPKGVTFPKSSVFRDFLLAKVINGENAAHKSEKFYAMATRTRQEYLKDLAENFVSTATVDSALKFSFITLGAKKKERVIPRRDAHLHSTGAIMWSVVAWDFCQSVDVHCLLGISNEFIVLIKEDTKNVIFNCSCRDVIGWTSTIISIKVYYERGECIMFSAQEGFEEDIRQIIQRLENSRDLSPPIPTCLHLLLYLFPTRSITLDC
ncbi:hypothetical protein QTP70_012234 [Hemibagrus guttatus]|uniref:ribonuclease H n=1 Tax=Hemibagrus guttatus TaxID=175788 RepID=A0AAE0RHX7_9TELE|nr:hypothetical protein QTP70_012234 [Hemibagrus guttatus]